MAKKRGRGRPPHDDVLTPSEWRTVHWVQHGMSNREIAERRGISIDAVKFHVANALGKLGLEDRRALRKWFKAPKHGALARQERKSMSGNFSLGRVGQISRTVKDIGQAEAWYRDVLGLRHLYTFGKLAFFDCGGTRLYLTQEGPLQAAESVLYFYVDDIETAHAALVKRGAEFTNAPHKIFTHADGTEEWMGFFKDLEGRPLALMSQVKAR